ncbi:MAG: hypothetical protein FJZ58_07840, partial [Chlamydiae bacterium]|nr:hypothetical protein [Chlamydiota bacterium]
MVSLPPSRRKRGEFSLLQITSLQNAKVKRAIALMNRKERDESALFLIEGFRELSRAVQGKVDIKELFFCPALFLGENELYLMESLQQRGTVLYQCSESVLRKISYRDRPDGLIAVAKQMELSFATLADDLAQLQKKQ